MDKKDQSYGTIDYKSKIIELVNKCDNAYVLKRIYNIMAKFV